MSIDAETLAVLRGYAEAIITEDLKTEVTIMHRERQAENDYGMTAETYVEGGTYLGWLVSKTSSDITRLGGMAGSTDEFELRLPIEAIVSPGDKAIIGGEEYVVQETNDEDTIPIFLEAILRRVQ